MGELGQESWEKFVLEQVKHWGFTFIGALKFSRISAEIVSLLEAMKLMSGFAREDSVSFFIIRL